MNSGVQFHNPHLLGRTGHYTSAFGGSQAVCGQFATSFAASAASPTIGAAMVGWRRHAAMVGGVVMRRWLVVSSRGMVRWCRHAAMVGWCRSERSEEPKAAHLPPTPWP